MGPEKIILLGGIVVAFGFFALTAKQADSMSMTSGEASLYRLQADQIASTGINLAAYYLSTPSWSDGVRMTNKPIFSGTLTYTIEYLNMDFDEARVISTGTYFGQTVTRIAIVEKITSTSKKGKRSWNQWHVKQITTLPFTTVAGAAM